MKIQEMWEIGDTNRPPQPAVPTLNVKVTIPLKYLINFSRFLDLPLINYETELDLSWTKDYLLIEHNNNIIGVNLMITSTKRYVLVVTLSLNDDIKFLENIKQGFKRTISWNKYGSEITTQPKNNNSNYLIDLTFRNINGLFVLSFKNGNDDPTRNSFNKYYMPSVEIKDFNALIDNKHFFNLSVKTNQKHLKNLLKCQEMLTTQQEIY